MNSHAAAVAKRLNLWQPQPESCDIPAPNLTIYNRLGADFTPEWSSPTMPMCMGYSLARGARSKSRKAS